MKLHHIFRIGLALLLAAAPIATLRARTAWATPSAASSSSAAPSDEVLAQVDPNPSDTGTNPSTDPDDAEWPDDDDNTNQPPNIDQAAPPTDKATEAAPDSTLKAKVLPTPAAAPLDTLGARPSAVAKKPLGAPVAERKPFFGIHPAVFYLGLLVGHIFVVRAVTN